MDSPFTKSIHFSEVKLDQRFFDSGKTFVKVTHNQGRMVGTRQHYHFSYLDVVKI